MHLVFFELAQPKCHLERAKLSDMKKRLLKQNDFE